MLETRGCSLVFLVTVLRLGIGSARTGQAVLPMPSVCKFGKDYGDGGWKAGEVIVVDTWMRTGQNQINMRKKRNTATSPSQK